MASPFRVFRKHQKRMLAVVGVLTILSFVFLPMFLKEEQSRQTSNPVVVSTQKFGDLRQSDLQGLLYHRQALRNFLERVQYELRQQGTQGWVANMFFRQLGDASEEAVVRTWLLSKQAEQLGMTVDDVSINATLNQITEGKLTGNYVKQILQGMHFPEAELFEALRTQLLAMHLQELFRGNAMNITPAERWDYFQRLKRKTKIELAAMPVAPFVDQVADPDDATLQAFFEKYKKTLPSPMSSEPGFRIPAKAALEYVRADYEKAVASTQVSDEEIQKYYEEHKELFQREKLPNAPQKPAEPPATEAPKTEAPKPETPPSAPATPEAAPSSPPAEEKAKEPAPAENKSSSARPASPFRLVAFQQEGSNGMAPASEPAQPETAKAEAPASPEPAKPETAAKPEPAKEAVLPTLDATTPPAAAPAAPAVEYRSLDEVREEIRRQLIQQRASQKIEELLQPLREKLNGYHTDSAVYEAAQQERATSPNTEVPPLPQRPDLAKLAEGLPLEVYSKPDLLTPYEVLDLPIGKSYVGQTGFVSYIFGKNMLKFNPISPIVDVDGNRYLAWVTDQSPEAIPSFDSVRPQVVRAWKLMQAKSLAQKEADKLAEEAGKANKPLKEVFADRKGIVLSEAGPFSWLTYGSLSPMAWGSQSPRLSEVPGVEAPGNDFMQAVFRLPVGGVGVAMNQPKTTVYIVRPLEFEPLPEVVWGTFLAEDISRYLPAAEHDWIEINRDWFKGLEQSAGLEWKREPKQTQERGE